MAGSPESIPCRRVVSLLRPLRAGLAAMVGLSVLGSLAGLVPPITLGYLINDLVERHGVKPEDALWAGLLAGAIVVEAAAYLGSDGLYARNSGRLYRNLRLPDVRRCDAPARERPAVQQTEGLPSRFVSDVETVERITVYALDTGSMLIVELGTALVVLGLMEPWAILVVVPLFAATWLANSAHAGTGRERRPAAPGAARGTDRNACTRTGRNGWSGRANPLSDRGRAAAARGSPSRPGAQAANLHISGVLAKLGPIAVVIAAASVGSYQAGTLLTLYLLAARAFYGFDGLVDLSLGMQSVRGAIARCLELIDPSQPSTHTRTRQASDLAA